MKKKRKVWEKILCTAAAVAVLAGGGFLGVEKFNPQKRSLQIIGGMRSRLLQRLVPKARKKRPPKAA